MLNIDDKRNGIYEKIVKNGSMVIGNRILDINRFSQTGTPNKWKISFVIPEPKVSATNLYSELYDQYYTTL